MYFGLNAKTSGTAYRQTECTGCTQGSSRELSPLLFYHIGQIIYISKLFLFKNLRKKEVVRMGFFTTAVTGLKTVVTAIGAGVAVWGVINLLEGYGNDNPGAKSQGVKQLMAGGGIVIVAQTVIPQLTSLFS